VNLIRNDGLRLSLLSQFSLHCKRIKEYQYNETCARRENCPLKYSFLNTNVGLKHGLLHVLKTVYWPSYAVQWIVTEDACSNLYLARDHKTDGWTKFCLSNATTAGSVHLFITYLMMQSVAHYISSNYRIVNEQWMRKNVEGSVRVFFSMALQPFGPWPLFSFLTYTQSVGLFERGISPSQGRYLHTEQHKYRINAHRHPCLEWDSNPRSQCWSGRPLWSAGLVLAWGLILNFCQQKFNETRAPQSG
jgi:hypothetical protein